MRIGKIVIFLMLCSLLSCFRDGELTMSHKAGVPIKFHSEFKKIANNKPGQIIEGIYVRTRLDNKLIIYAWGYMWSVDSDSLVFDKPLQKQY